MSVKAMSNHGLSYNFTTLKLYEMQTAEDISIK